MVYNFLRRCCFRHLIHFMGYATVKRLKNAGLVVVIARQNYYILIFDCFFAFYGCIIRQLFGLFLINFVFLHHLRVANKKIVVLSSIFFLHPHL